MTTSCRILRPQILLPLLVLFLLSPVETKLNLDKVSQTSTETILFASSLNNLYGSVVTTLKLTAESVAAAYANGWTQANDPSVLSLTYLTAEMAAHTPWPYAFGVLVDLRSDRLSEFYAQPNLVSPEAITPGETCECAPVEWELFCNATFPGQGVCTPCVNFCEIRDGFEESRLLEGMAPGVFTVFSQIDTLYITRNSGKLEWGRYLFSGFKSFAFMNASLPQLFWSMGGSESSSLCEPSTNPTREVAFSVPIKNEATDDLRVSICSPSYYEDHFVAGCYVGLTIEETVNTLEDHSYDEDQFAMLFTNQGAVIGGSQLGFRVLFGAEFNKSSDVYYLQNSTIDSYQIVPGTNWGKMVISGTAYLVFVEQVSNTPWVLMVFQPEASFILKQNTWKVVIGVALPVLFVTGIVVLVSWSVLLRTRAQVQDLETQMGLINAPSQNLMGTPAELVVQKLMAINKHKKITAEDHLALSEVIGLVASNKLYKADYISKKQMGLVSLDTEVDHFLTTTLLRYNSDEREMEQRSLSKSLSSSSMGRELGKELKQHDKSGKALKLDSWDFNVLCVQQPPAIAFCLVIMEILEQYDLFAKLTIDKEKVDNFLKKISLGYFDNPYHCAVHAADVAQALHIFIKSLGLGIFTDLEVFAGIFACAIHDFKHPGVNNNFLQTTFDRIALRYNGISILENMHAAEAFKVLFGSPETNFLSSWDKAQQIEFHRLVTTLVLSTDMAKHVELLGQFKAKVASGGKMDYSKKSDRELTLQLFIKYADVNNPSRCWSTASVWAQRIMEEFFRQGDEEKRRNLPVSPFMDRSSNKVPKCQGAFIEFVIMPFATVFVQVVPQLEETIMTNVRNNLQSWQRAQNSPSAALSTDGDK
ncbi:cAMP-specific 3',5'-cAMP phosphodiesterase 4 [Pelomyxa schiedti]|nr:cAMP-specific 3',5'-cAMP phosphodiesterase 4 [Pelomyxa schiedti]